MGSRIMNRGTKLTMPIGPSLNAVLDCIAERDRTRREIVEATGEKYDTVCRCLKNLEHEYGLICRVDTTIRTDVAGRRRHVLLFSTDLSRAQPDLRVRTDVTKLSIQTPKVGPSATAALRQRSALELGWAGELPDVAA